jgi:hypothetical protein
MKMIRKHKGYAVVLGLAGIVVVADQCFFLEATGPSTARAATGVLVAEPLSATLSPPIASPVETLSDIGQERPAIAERLQGLAQKHRLQLSEIDDGFDRPSSWKQQEQTVRELKASQARANDFRTKHHLAAVLTAERQGLAVLEGKPIRIGQTIDGFTLVAVAHHSAVFEANGIRVELSMRSEAREKIAIEE